MQNLRTVHMCVLIIVYNCLTQYKKEQLLFFPPDNHQGSDAVHWREERGIRDGCSLLTGYLVLVLFL